MSIGIRTLLPWIDFIPLGSKAKLEIISILSAVGVEINKKASKPR